MSLAAPATKRCLLSFPLWKEMREAPAELLQDISANMDSKLNHIISPSLAEPFSQTAAHLLVSGR